MELSRFLLSLEDSKPGRRKLFGRGKNPFLWLTAVPSTLLGVPGPYLGAEEGMVGAGGVGVGEVMRRKLPRCRMSQQRREG